MNIIKENLREEIKTQKEIDKILGKYRLSFDCPHCYKEINETHFDEKSRALKVINEKLRNITEQEYIFRQNLYREQWLKELIENKKYEEFAGFTNLRKRLNE